MAELSSWDPRSGEIPGEPVFDALYRDLFIAVEAKEHTKLGTRLNYEKTGLSSLFRSTGRKVDDIGKSLIRMLEKTDKAWKNAGFWHALMSGGEGAVGNTDLLEQERARLRRLTGDDFDADIGFVPGAEISQLLPRTARAYTQFALFKAISGGRDVAKTKPWEAVRLALVEDLKGGADLGTYSGPGAEELRAAQAALADAPEISYREAFLDIDEGWGDVENWQTIYLFSSKFTNGYYLNALDLKKAIDGIAPRPENERIYMTLFKRTIFMSVVITVSCILLGYPVAWLLANLPARTANLLMILVLLPFWTSLLVRTSAWKVMLQQQGVINDVLVWLGMVDDAHRLVMINNQFGTIVAMTHILLPFMILPMYSVMQTIPPSYLRAAKSLGANNWTAFWRVYFPQTIPGIGAGAILVFILSIGYYITPEIVGGRTGTFISNRIAYHISSSLNWGLAAALGTILLAAVLILYWAYDKIVGIDNVKLG